MTRTRSIFATPAAAALALLLSALPTTAYAQSSTEQARDYLLGTQDPRGSWGATREATSLRDTATVLRALSDIGLGASPEFGAGATWLAGEQRRNADDSARAIEALHGTPLQFATDDDRAVLLAAQLPRSGWGLGLLDGELSAIDTALAARSLYQELGFDDVWYVFDALSLAQNADGGWGIDDESMVAMTAEVVVTLSQGELAVPEVGPTIDAAVDYLLSRQDVDGRIGAGPLETALAARAILMSKRPAPTAVADALAYLLSEQFADGSWEGDPYTTAEVLLALGDAGANLALDAAGVAFTPSSATVRLPEMNHAA